MKTQPVPKGVRYGKGAKRNMPKVYELEKLDPRQEKSTTTEVRGEICSRRVNQENLTHAKRNLL
ncbi:unnamed protein product [Musa acuminata subsp. malaccensis]|uniref:(wild Malaysian banana) hypothetical protein n=1 Tax=Musa acuminata subsp. malaccensis TaxID=214687 RepID=A0A804J0U3_MUSAM|nr:unnamed protein product [Musa acuminata subsp. malaccensis]